MRLPADPLDFVAPPVPDFRIAGWEHAFGRYQWFYVVGARGLLAKAGISDLTAATKKVSKIVVPTEWKNSYGLPFEWSYCSANQVRRSFNLTPQRFDRALMSIIAIVEAVKDGKNQKFIDSFNQGEVKDYISLKPANFEIEDFDKKELRKVDPNTRRNILAAAKQKHDRFLDEIAIGHGATFHTLDLVSKSLHALSPPVGSRTVSPKQLRGRNGLAMKPAPSEVVI